MLNFLKAITALKDIINTIKSLWSAWEKHRRSKAKEKLAEKAEKAIQTGDQREFEKEIGSSNAGKPTRHDLSSVRRRKRQDRR